MKKINLLILIFVIAIQAFAQQSSDFFNQLTAKYADQDGFSASILTRDMFDLYLKKKNLDETSPVSEALKKLDKILVVSQSNSTVEFINVSPENSPKENKNELHKLMLDYYAKNGYMLFKTEKRMGEDVKVYLKKAGEKVESLALVTNSNMATNLVELQGDIDLKTVAELAKAFNLRGLENLNKIDNSNSFGAYGPIFTYSPQQTEEFMAHQHELIEKQQLLSKEQVAAFEDQAKAAAEKQLILSKTYREMADKYGREPIFLNYPGDTNTVYYINGKKVKAKEIKDLDKGKIESIEIKKPEKADDKTTIRIKTK